jgi:hypothetical protein
LKKNSLQIKVTAILPGYAELYLLLKKYQLEFEKFFEDKKEIIALKRDIILASQEISNRVKWREHNEKSVRDFLEKN